jgi:hypothetical protein
MAGEQCIGGGRRVCRAEIAVLAGVAGLRDARALLLLAGDTGGDAVADDRERVGRCSEGSDRHEAEQNDMEGDRVDRQYADDFLQADRMLRAAVAPLPIG